MHICKRLSHANQYSVSQYSQTQLLLHSPTSHTAGTELPLTKRAFFFYRFSHSDDAGDVQHILKSLQLPSIYSALIGSGYLETCARTAEKTLPITQVVELNKTPHARHPQDGSLLLIQLPRKQHSQSVKLLCWYTAELASSWLHHCCCWIFESDNSRWSLKWFEQRALTSVIYLPLPLGRVALGPWFSLSPSSSLCVCGDKQELLEFGKSSPH